MASSKNVVPEAKEALNRFKMEAASEVGVKNQQNII
ncbi:MAG: small, acid-soluble spore protein, alpha/beta type [Eubacterium sp.]|nr:small, acid-soluble spore protein, alpha/beta type [Eubacterium sp.]